MEDSKAKGDSDMITMVKFSTNERLLAVANHSSIKLFEVKLIVQKEQFYLFEFETPPFCSEFSFFQFSLFGDTPFSPSPDTAMLYIDDRGGLGLCGVVNENVQYIERNGVSAACFSSLESQSHLYFIDSRLTFHAVKFSVNNKSLLTWQTLHRTDFRPFMKEGDHIKLLKQLNAGCFLILGVNLNIQGGIRWARIVCFQENQSEQLTAEYIILPNQVLPRDTQQLYRFQFQVVSSRDGLFHYITDNFSDSLEALYSSPENPQEFRLANQGNQQGQQQQGQGQNTNGCFQLPSNGLEIGGVKSKGLCIIETKIDGPTVNQEIWPSLLVLTNGYLIGRLMVQSPLFRHNSIQNKLNFNEEDDVYSGNNDDIADNIQQTTSTTQELQNPQNSQVIQQEVTTRRFFQIKNGLQQRDQNEIEDSKRNNQQQQLQPKQQGPQQLWQMQLQQQNQPQQMFPHNIGSQQSNDSSSTIRSQTFVQDNNTNNNSSVQTSDTRGNSPPALRKQNQNMSIQIGGSTGNTTSNQLTTPAANILPFSDNRQPIPSQNIFDAQQQQPGGIVSGIQNTSGELNIFQRNDALQKQEQQKKQSLITASQLVVPNTVSSAQLNVGSVPNPQDFTKPESQSTTALSMFGNTTQGLKPHQQQRQQALNQQVQSNSLFSNTRDSISKQEIPQNKVVSYYQEDKSNKVENQTQVKESQQKLLLNKQQQIIQQNNLLPISENAEINGKNRNQQEYPAQVAQQQQQLQQYQNQQQQQQQQQQNPNSQLQQQLIPQPQEQQSLQGQGTQLPDLVLNKQMTFGQQNQQYPLNANRMNITQNTQTLQSQNQQQTQTNQQDITKQQQNSFNQSNQQQGVSQQQNQAQSQLQIQPQQVQQQLLPQPQQSQQQQLSIFRNSNTNVSLQNTGISIGGQQQSKDSIKTQNNQQQSMNPNNNINISIPKVNQVQNVFTQSQGVTTQNQSIFAGSSNNNNTVQPAQQFGVVSSIFNNTNNNNAIRNALLQGVNPINSASPLDEWALATQARVSLVAWLEQQLNRLKNMESRKITQITDSAYICMSEVRLMLAMCLGRDGEYLKDKIIEPIYTFLDNLKDDCQCNPRGILLSPGEYQGSLLQLVNAQQTMEYKQQLENIKSSIKETGRNLMRIERQVCLLEQHGIRILDILDNHLSIGQKGIGKQSVEGISRRDLILAGISIKNKGVLIGHALFKLLKERLDRIEKIDREIQKAGLDQIREQMKGKDIEQMIDELSISNNEKDNNNLEKDRNSQQCSTVKRNGYSMEGEEGRYENTAVAATTVQKKQAFDKNNNQGEQLTNQKNSKELLLDNQSTIKKNNNTVNLDFRSLLIDHNESDSDEDSQELTNQCNDSEKRNKQTRRSQKDTVDGDEEKIESLREQFQKKIQDKRLQFNRSQESNNNSSLQDASTLGQYSEFNNNNKKLIEKKELLRIDGRTSLNRIQHKSSNAMFKYLQQCIPRKLNAIVTQDNEESIYFVKDDDHDDKKNDEEITNQSNENADKNRKIQGDNQKENQQQVCQETQDNQLLMLIANQTSNADCNLLHRYLSRVDNNPRYNIASYMQFKRDAYDEVAAAILQQRQLKKTQQDGSNAIGRNIGSGNGIVPPSVFTKQKEVEQDKLQQQKNTLNGQGSNINAAPAVVSVQQQQQQSQSQQNGQSITGKSIFPIIQQQQQQKPSQTTQLPVTANSIPTSVSLGNTAKNISLQGNIPNNNNNSQISQSPIFGPPQTGQQAPQNGVVAKPEGNQNTNTTTTNLSNIQQGQQQTTPTMNIFTSKPQAAGTTVIALAPQQHQQQQQTAINQQKTLQSTQQLQAQNQQQQQQQLLSGSSASSQLGVLPAQQQQTQPSQNIFSSIPNRPTTFTPSSSIFSNMGPSTIPSTINTASNGINQSSLPAPVSMSNNNNSGQVNSNNNIFSTSSSNNTLGNNSNNNNNNSIFNNPKQTMNGNPSNNILSSTQQQQQQGYQQQQQSNYIPQNNNIFSSSMAQSNAPNNNNNNIFSSINSNSTTNSNSNYLQHFQNQTNHNNNINTQNSQQPFPNQQQPQNNQSIFGTGNTTINQGNQGIFNHQQQGNQPTINNTQQNQQRPLTNQEYYLQQTAYYQQKINPLAQQNQNNTNNTNSNQSQQSTNNNGSIFPQQSLQQQSQRQSNFAIQIQNFEESRRTQQNNNNQMPQQQQPNSNQQFPQQQEQQQYSQEQLNVGIRPQLNANARAQLLRQRVEQKVQTGGMLEGH